MQDQYVGDIGDFANNGLLRWLCGTRDEAAADGLGQLDLAIVSYFRQPDQNDIRMGHGGVIGYLSGTPANNEDFRMCDPELYLALRRSVFEDARQLSLMQQLRIPNANTVYYNDPINGPIDRVDWLEQAYQRAHDAQLIFLNPDNGIHADVVRPENGGSDKHLYLSDLDTIWRGEQSLVIYHHAPRRNAQGVIDDLMTRIQDRTGLEIHALRFRRWVSRFYFIVVHPDQCAAINGRLISFLNPNLCQWGADRMPRFSTPHFTNVGLG